MLEKPYHHGDLRNALVQSAAELAEAGGPEAVTIRAAARAVGVTPTATYRHFADRDALLAATKDECLDRMAAHFLARMAELPDDLSPAELAVERFRAAGRAYVEFAIEESGLYRTCLCSSPGEGDELPEEAPPYQLLTLLLDDLMAAGEIDPECRPQAEHGAWALVHGLAMLLIEGPLQHLDEAERAESIERALTIAIRGLRPTR